MWDEIIFTKNTTEALNLVAYAWGLQHLREGDEVVRALVEDARSGLPLEATLRRFPQLPTTVGGLDTQWREWVARAG